MCFLNSSEDLIIWPDGTNCFRYELHEMNHMSDDFEIVRFNDAAVYAQRCHELGLD
jgi:hypothetical protein